MSRPIRSALLPALLVLALAGCGQKGGLRPRSAQSGPPAPYGREQSPSTDTMLTPPPQAAPERSVELRTRSEQREDDPFNLPPEE